jgi:DedD protein
MDQQLKQRLVGISVIFALAVIFVPMILDGSGQRPKALDIEIPEAPQVEARVDVRQKVIELKREVEKIPLKEPLIVDRTSEALAENTPDQSKPESTPPPVEPVTPPAAKEPAPKAEKSVDKPKPAAKPKPVKTEPTKPKPQVGGDSWVIQVGSFQDKDKAFKQRDRLRKSRLSAVFIEQYRHNGALRYRVRMGPFLQRDKAQVIRNKVLAKYNIKGLVMRYEQ